MYIDLTGAGDLPYIIDINTLEDSLLNLDLESILKIIDRILAEQERRENYEGCQEVLFMRSRLIEAKKHEQ